MLLYRKTISRKSPSKKQHCNFTFKNGIKKGTFIWAINSVDNSIQLQDALSPAELLEEYFDRENKNGILSYDAYLSYVQQNYKTAEYYDKLVTNISKRLKYGINQEIFTWTISNVDKRIPCPKGFTPLDTAGSSQHAELLEKSKRMDNEFDGEYFDRTK
ncbi:uncharacterized protein LOC126845812 isoform X2 [Adelges cooleyi]|uniref:uncharacterized protein LOC126845812 isoform X2 n=1 Tax=Adelges cooleyi TaxID=133065 RepID=UPI00217FA321|nr:uncharacterized protein LOC126845812 isoform X2 [Adelges cooleyi]XP_050440691.1 uncharacterized protein LOC126845812 isoform X2 [Adelges cooleyi]